MVNRTAFERLVLPVVLLCGCVGVVASGLPQGAPTDPTAAILAAHKKADDDYRLAPMSPFTAIAVQYFTPGQSFRFGATASGVAFGDAAASSPDVIELALDGDAFSVTPVKGARPGVAKTSGSGDISRQPEIPVTAKTKLARREVVHLGRFFVEFNTSPGNGNARVFDPNSAARKAFTGLKWYAPSLALQVKARFVGNPSPSAVTITTSRGLQREYFRVGTFEFSVDGKALKLTALATSAALKDGDELFVAFRDATTGQETYDVGRYLFIPFKGSAAYTLDFNLATNPLCNYSPHYNCPIPLKENVLSVPIRAGEMKFPTAH
jgi:uncharacterized protein